MLSARPLSLQDPSKPAVTGKLHPIVRYAAPPQESKELSRLRMKRTIGLGTSTAILIAYVLSLLIDTPFLPGPIVNSLLLAVGLFHMGIITKSTRKILKNQLSQMERGEFEDKVPANSLELGSLIAMSGYLHTLIGVSAAIAALTGGIFQGDSSNTQEFNGMLAVALGTATSLLTSVVGWWAGKEFQCERWRPVELTDSTYSLTLAEDSC